MKLKIKGLLLAIGLMPIFAACDDNDLGTAPRLFTPIVAEDIGGTWIKATWDRYAGTLSYNLQLAEDEAFVNILANVSINEEQDTEYTFENLWYNTQYYIRIQGIGNGGIKSNVATYPVKTLKLPTKLLSPASSDCIDTKIKVKWTEAVYDNLQVYQGKDHVKTIDLTTEDNAEKTVLITDLEPATTYTVHAYQGEEYVGEMDYKTVAAQVFYGAIVDLRGLSPTDAYSKLTQTYIDELATQYPNGFTVILEGGIHYGIETVNLSTSFNLVTGLNFSGNAIIEHNGGIGIKPDANIGFIIIDNIIFTDHPSAPKESGNFGGKYALDVRGTNEGARIGKLSLLGCDIRYKRGLFRAQSAVEIDSIVIDNCFIDSIGGYGVTNADNEKAYFKNVVAKNSTIAYAEKIFIGAKAVPVDRQNSLTLENLTICYSPKGTGNYIVDYNNQTLPGGVTIKNCIVGAGGTTIRGMRSAAANINIDNNFRANDMAWTLNATTGEPESPIDLTPLSAATIGVFANPENLNFKVTDANLINKVGDPRWWR
ncbi:hypothetical protein AGMMS4957_11630 [Bacteroidia bacterium]|nr:hypothetical protein AGMMS4957_11630 [Bacteroidia bacterium]